MVVVGAVCDQRPVNLVRQLGLEGTMIFAGVPPHMHVPVFHALAELEAMWFGQADGGKNSLGIAGKEAMLTGNPVLSISNIDTFGPGVLISGRDVIILKAVEANALSRTIIEFLNSHEKIAHIGNAAQARKRFTWPKIAAVTAEVYRSLIPSSNYSLEGVSNERHLKMYGGGDWPVLIFIGDIETVKRIAPRVTVAN